MFKEFKEFAVKGNVVELGIAVVFGAAFEKIISSFVSDLLMPLISVVIGNTDYTNLYLILAGPTGPFATLMEAQKAGAITLNYGKFFGIIFNFMMIALALFFFVKFINKMKREKAVEAPKTKECNFCFSEIPLAALRCPHCTSELKR